MCQASTCGRVRARALVQVLQNSGSRMVVLRFTTLSARDRHWRNPRKKNYRERSNIKSARVSALTGSVPRKMAEAQQRVSALFRIRTHVARLTATSLKPLNRINRWKKRYMTRRISPLANDFFAYRTVVLGFFKLNIKARHEIRELLNANLWSIHLISFNIDWSWNIFTSHNFAQCSSSSSMTSKKWEVKTWNLGQIFEIELWMVGQ